MIHNEYAYAFKCFSHRSRIRLLELLATHEEMSVNEITLAFQLGEFEDRDASTISRNLNILKQQGFVSSRREGQTKYYVLNADKVEALFGAFVTFLDEAKTRSNVREDLTR